jgi:hypothetical protein
VCGKGWQETGMVFTTTVGTMLDPRNMLRTFYTIMSTPDRPTQSQIQRRDATFCPACASTICATAPQHCCLRRASLRDTSWSFWATPQSPLR